MYFLKSVSSSSSRQSQNRLERFEIVLIIRLSQSPFPFSAFKVDSLAIPHDSAPIAKRPLSSFSAGPKYKNIV